MIVEDIIHSGIPNYTKLAFNSLKMIQIDPVSQPIKRDDRPSLTRVSFLLSQGVIKRRCIQLCCSFQTRAILIIARLVDSLI